VRNLPAQVQVVLALISALLFALGTVLQQKAGIDAPASATSRGLLWAMAHRRVWVAGIASDVVGFVAQAAALRLGQLAVVQPLLVLSVVFALPLGARLSDQHFGRREAAAAALVVVALAGFLAIANPSGGRNEVALSRWLVAGVACAAVCVPLSLLGRHGPAPRRAALLGAAAGVLFALSAALTKSVVDELHLGVVHVVESWEPYALVGVGYFSMTLNQLALNTRSLAATLATSTAVDPVVSVALGLALFDEQLHANGLQAVAAFVALAAALLGVVVLARAEAPETMVAQPSGSS
jgi:drug/metabolite transporter (DMT)-like permease